MSEIEHDQKGSLTLSGTWRVTLVSLVYWGFIGCVLGVYWGCIGGVLALYWGVFGVYWCCIGKGLQSTGLTPSSLDGTTFLQVGGVSFINLSFLMISH